MSFTRLSPFLLASLLTATTACDSSSGPDDGKEQDKSDGVTCINDGLDNNGDGRIDETGEGCAPTSCDEDGLDNNGDGLVDEEDEVCAAASCDQDAFDNNGDGTIDEAGEACGHSLANYVCEPELMSAHGLSIAGLADKEIDRTSFDLTTKHTPFEKQQMLLAVQMASRGPIADLTEAFDFADGGIEIAHIATETEFETLLADWVQVSRMGADGSSKVQYDILFMPNSDKIIGRAILGTDRLAGCIQHNWSNDYSCDLDLRRMFGNNSDEIRDLADPAKERVIDSTTNLDDLNVVTRAQLDATLKRFVDGLSLEEALPLFDEGRITIHRIAYEVPVVYPEEERGTELADFVSLSMGDTPLGIIFYAGTDLMLAYVDDGDVYACVGG